MSTARKLGPHDDSGLIPADVMLDWFSRILAPDQHCEVRSGKRHPDRSHRFGPDQRAEMITEALRLSNVGQEVYFVLNPILAETDGTANDAMIERRLLMLVDCDPTRDANAMKAAGPGTKLSTTDAEKEHARGTIVEIRDYLRSLDWPDPVEADSGNGFHLLYPVDLENVPASRELVKAVLLAVARRFDTADATVDTSVFNASRISKFYGTRARKGITTPDRPHRVSTLLAIPEGFGTTPVSRAQLDDMAAEVAEQAASASPKLSVFPVVTAGNGQWTPEARAVAYLQKCEPAIQGQKGSNATLKAACKIGPGFNLDEETTLRLLKQVYNPTCQPEWSEKDLTRKVKEAYRVESRRGWLLNEPRKGDQNGYHAGNGQAIPPGGGGTADGERPPERPAIVISTEEHEVIDQAVKAIEADPTIYQRGNMLVTVLHNAPRVAGLKRPIGSPRIVMLPTARLRERLTSHATWHKLRKTRDGGCESIPAHPPDWAIAGVAARGEWHGIRPLEAVIETPTIRADGTILDTPGWDRTTLLYEPNADFPSVPSRPSHEVARKAAEILLYPVVDFPFVEVNEDGGLAHRAAWLAGLLTPLARFAIAGPCPLFAFDANTPASGKSKLTDLIAIINSGRDMPRTVYPDSDDEMRKRITSIALAGDRMMLIDNIATTFGGSSLDSALTAMTWRDRLLGRSEMSPELPLFTVWFATGNNLAFRGDVLRRVIPCRLESNEERPEERRDFTIKGDLLDFARRERGNLVIAGLTLLRAHVLAGSPDGGLSPLGSFEAWSRIVRSAVYWAIGADPCATREQLREADPETIARNALVEGWAELPGSDRGLTAAEALKTVKDNEGRFEILRGVLLEMGQRNELPSTKTLGVRLKKIKDRVVSGLVIRARTYQGTQIWRVEKTGGSGGSGGSVSNPSRENSSDNCNTSFREEGREHSHHSHHSHGAIPSDWKITLANWPIPWRERYGVVANDLTKEGYTYPADEIEAFARVSAEKAAADLAANPFPTKAASLFAGVATSPFRVKMTDAPRRSADGRTIEGWD